MTEKAEAPPSGVWGLREIRIYEQMLRSLTVAMEDGTVDFAHDHPKGFTSNEYAAALEISLQAANNRLIKLYNNHLLDRERVAPNGRGKLFRYIPTKRLLHPGVDFLIEDWNR
jgi:hypothetical protein